MLEGEAAFLRTFELSTRIQSISRAEGRSATAAAAYRSCSAITCERGGRTHDYRRKKGLETALIVLPDGAPAWAADRSSLWNAAELRERNGKRGKNALAFKADAVTAREFMFSFPAELSPEGRLQAATTIARHLADTHGIAADFAIHRPGKDGDSRNFHCHMLTTTRRLAADGLTEKAREWTALKTGAVLAKHFRAFVAQTLTQELAREGKAHLVKVEYLSFKERGSGQKPTRHQGPARTNSLRHEKGQAREAWIKAVRTAQAERHRDELASLKSRQAFALAVKDGDLVGRERKGIAAIQEALRAAQDADKAPSGASRLFQVAAGKAMKADFERQQRAAQRVEAASQQIAELKASLQAERAALAASHAAERAALIERHRQEDQQFSRAAAARQQFDRVAEVQARRPQGHGHDHEHGRRR